MSDPISSEFIKKVAADLKNPDHINVTDGPMVKGKPEGIQLALSNSIEGDAGKFV